MPIMPPAPQLFREPPQLATSTKLSHIFGKNTVLFHKQDVDLPEDFVGIEVETEGNSANAFQAGQNLIHWETKEDHSLRDGGLEYITRTPLCGKTISEAIGEFVDHARFHNLEHSLRTAIHIHVNMSNIKDDVFVAREFFCLYLLVEDALFNWAGSWRKHTGYCVPLYESLPYLNTWEDFLRNPTTDTLINAVNPIPRYSSLNLKALKRHGTLEVRLFPTVYDKGIIFDWAKALLMLKKTSLRLVDKAQSAIDLADSLQLNEFYQEIFGKDLGEKIAAFTSEKEVDARAAFLGSIIHPFVEDAVEEAIEGDAADWPIPGKIKTESIKRYPLLRHLIDAPPSGVVAVKKTVKRNPNFPNHLIINNPF